MKYHSNAVSKPIVIKAVPKLQDFRRFRKGKRIPKCRYGRVSLYHSHYEQNEIYYTKESKIVRFFLDFASFIVYLAP